MNNQIIKNINTAKVENIYTSVHIIKNNFKIIRNGVKEDDTFYTIIGTNIKNIKHTLYLTHNKNNDIRMWLDIFETFKNRGIQEILFLSSADDKNIKKALRIAYPNAKYMKSLIELSYIFYTYSVERHCEKIHNDIKKLFISETLETFADMKKEFDDTYNNPIHNKLKEMHLSNVENVYKIPFEIRKMIYSVNKNMEHFYTLKKYFNERVFKNLDDLYDQLSNEVITDFYFYSFNRRQWISILNELMLQYPELDFI